MLLEQINLGLEKPTAVPFQGEFIIAQGRQFKTDILSDFTKLTTFFIEPYNL